MIESVRQREILLAFIVISLIAAFIELSYGSVYVGIAFFFLCLCLLFFTKRSSEKKGSSSRSLFLLFIGAILIISDITYNFISQSDIQTLDSMILLLGLSLIIANMSKKFGDIGAFGTYMCIFFFIFFALLYIIPSKLNIKISHYYGHYFIALPICSLLNIFGFDLSLPETGTIMVNGFERAWLKMDLACFGWYSMILIVSALLSYNITIERFQGKKLLRMIFVMVVASYFANFLRVSILVLLTYFYGVETMMIFHSHIGWILFAIILLPLMYIFMKKEHTSS
ncbi:MAG: archaeosortase C [Candidatus Methanospirare jalkutatii]|nr:archaeosortase C [Candidatus Methanospirare jalkutatii]